MEAISPKLLIDQSFFHGIYRNSSSPGEFSPSIFRNLFPGEPQTPVSWKVQDGDVMYHTGPLNTRQDLGTT